MLRKFENIYLLFLLKRDHLKYFYWVVVKSRHVSAMGR